MQDFRFWHVKVGITSRGTALTWCRDLISDDAYYTATTGKIPIRWTAPEVVKLQALFANAHSGGCQQKVQHCNRCLGIWCDSVRMSH